jgi:beta-lactamase class A
VAIMLNAYINLPEFTKRQEQALEKMIVESDNLEANYLLAAAIGGGGTEDAIKGAEAMSAMLADLGLENTYQYVPYEAGEYIRLNKLKVKSGPKDPVGPAPHTESGRWLRTTPAEMAQLYVWIEQCSRGEGLLLEKFAETLTAERCKAMIARLEKNGDTERMVAGLPPGTVVAHKSGWIDITQADVGIVRSPGGDYVAAIYLYRPIDGPQPPIPDRILMSSIANISRLIYSYYNPVVAP